MSKIVIFGAPGTGCNHLRWLLLTCTEWNNNKIKDIDFFRNEVYPRSRTWYNWLIFEKKFKTLLNEQTQIIIPRGNVHHTLFPDLNAYVHDKKNYNLFITPINNIDNIIHKYAMINSYFDGADLTKLPNFMSQWYTDIVNTNYNNKVLWDYVWFLDNNKIVEHLEKICKQCELQQPNRHLIESINQMWLDSWQNLHKDFQNFLKYPIK